MYICIQLPEAIPPLCLGMFGWSAGGSMGSYACQLVNQWSSQVVNQSNSEPANQSNMNPTNWPEEVQKVIKNPAKIYQIGSKICLKSIPEGVLGGLMGSWGPSWLQDGPKSEQDLENRFRGPPLGGQVGSQNPLKSFPRAVQNVIHFLMGCCLGFKSILVPTWPQLGSQNRPKMEPNLSQNRTNWGHCFRS